MGNISALAVTNIVLLIKYKNRNILLQGTRECSTQEAVKGNLSSVPVLVTMEAPN